MNGSQMLFIGQSHSPTTALVGAVPKNDITIDNYNPNNNNSNQNSGDAATLQVLNSMYDTDFIKATDKQHKVIENEQSNKGNTINQTLQQLPEQMKQLFGALFQGRLSVDKFLDILPNIHKNKSPQTMPTSDMYESTAFEEPLPKENTETLGSFFLIPTPKDVPEPKATIFKKYDTSPPSAPIITSITKDATKNSTPTVDQNIPDKLKLNTKPHTQTQLQQPQLPQPQIQSQPKIEITPKKAIDSDNKKNNEPIDKDKEIAELRQQIYLLTVDNSNLKMSQAEMENIQKENDALKKQLKALKQENIKQGKTILKHEQKWDQLRESARKKMGGKLPHRGDMNMDNTTADSVTIPNTLLDSTVGEERRTSSNANNFKDTTADSMMASVSHASEMFYSFEEYKSHH